MSKTVTGCCLATCSCYLLQAKGAFLNDLAIVHQRPGYRKPAVNPNDTGEEQPQRDDNEQPLEFAKRLDGICPHGNS